MADEIFYAIGSAEGVAEAKRRIAEAARAGAEELDLGGLGLTEIPEQLLGLRQLKALYLGLPKDSSEKPYWDRTEEDKKLYNAVSALPPAFFASLLNLARLHLEHNQLTSLPDTIGQLTSLQGLALGNNQLASLPDTIGQLTSLQGLSLHNNQLASLPDTIGQLTSLQWLYLDNNQLASLPDTIGQLTSLQGLALNNNQLASLPDTIGQLTSLQGLYLKNNQLASLPDIIGQLTSLQWLDLKNNQLASLPDIIGQLTSLQGLALGNNQLASLPDIIGQLTSLQGLVLDNNQLASLPGTIGQLTSLQSLFLHNNQLASLPDTIGQLTSLQWLYLDDNQLASLPDIIGQLTSLQLLSLHNNQLASLPDTIGQLTGLQWLYLDNNQLASLPDTIGQLTSLQGLSLGNNRLAPAFEKAWNEGGIAALRALLDASRKHSEPLYEAKLLVTGEGNVGKSWALARLRGDDPHETVRDATTYGVDRGELLLDHPEAGKSDKIPVGTRICLNTWDFGGQKVYRITHQFFFTQAAIFLLVWNPRSGAEQCRVREWLRMIELRTGGNAKVIMVASHSPSPVPYLPDYGKDRLPKELAAMIVDEIAIDSVKGDNIPELRTMIARHAASLPFMGDPFPVSWQNAREAVAALNPPDARETPHISYARFEQICQDSSINDPDQMFTLATVFMHNLGRAVYYGKRHLVSAPDASESEPEAKLSSFEDAQLANIMVLDAEWLSRAFVQVLQDQPTVDAGGMLDHARLDAIWRSHGREDWQTYSLDEHPYLIRLMHAFDISYVVKGREGRQSLVPQLLPVAEPELPWRTPPDRPGARPVRLICRMGDEAQGLMARFIVQTAPYHVFGDGCGAFWHDGVFLRETTYDTEALVALKGREKPVMTMTVAGGQPAWFLGELYRTLASLLDFWPGLDKTFLIGCPTRREDGGFCEGEFEFDFLIAEDKEAPDNTHACRTCRQRYKPRELLFGYAGVEELKKGPVQILQERDLAMKQAPCPRAFTLMPADRSKWDPRKFLPGRIAGQKLRLTLLSEHSLTPVTHKDFEVHPKWVKWIGPIARLGALGLTGMAVPLTGALEHELGEAARFMSSLGGLRGKDEIGIPQDDRISRGWPSGADLEDLHNLLKAIGVAPHFGDMQFVEIRHKGYLWVSKEEAEAHAEEIPNLVYMPDKKPK